MSSNLSSSITLRKPKENNLLSHFLLKKNQNSSLSFLRQKEEEININLEIDDSSKNNLKYSIQKSKNNNDSTRYNFFENYKKTTEVNSNLDGLHEQMHNLENNEKNEESESFYFEKSNYEDSQLFLFQEVSQNENENEKCDNPLFNNLRDSISSSSTLTSNITNCNNYNYKKETEIKKFELDDEIKWDSWPVFSNLSKNQPTYKKSNLSIKDLNKILCNSNYHGGEDKTNFYYSYNIKNNLNKKSEVIYNNYDKDKEIHLSW